MPNTPLGTARRSVNAKIGSLVAVSAMRASEPEPTAETALTLADQLDFRVGALVTAISLMRHEAKTEILNRGKVPKL